MDDNPERMVYLARHEALYRWLSTASPRDSPPIDDPDSVDFMTALAGDYQPSSGWTDDELEHIPDGIRYEIEDGNLVVSTRPTPWHQKCGFLLAAAMLEHCPPELWPVQDTEIRVYDENKIAQVRAPDVMVVPRSLTELDASRPWAHPHEAMLIVEVVSPSSRVADRITKVGVYAEWGIPLYLRLESKPEIALYEYRFDAETKQYGTRIAHRDVFTTDTPFRLQVELSRLS